MPGPLVHRRGQPLPAVEGAVELALEDGDAPPGGPGPAGRICPSATTSCGRSDGRPAVRLIVAPARCHLPEGLRAWGWAIQLYALRSRESWGIGDLADLRAARRVVGERRSGRAPWS